MLFRSKIETRKGGQIPGTVTKVDNGQVYFTHPNGKTYKTHAGNVRRVKEEVEQIDELSKDTLSSYSQKAKDNYDTTYNTARKISTDGRLDRGLMKIVAKRSRGIQKADQKMKEEVINERGENKYKRATEKGAGLTKAGVAKHRREHPGSKLSTAVTTEPSKLKHGSKAWNRRKSFCARMGGMKGPMKDSKGRPTRKAMSLRRWHCE